MRLRGSHALDFAILLLPLAVKKRSRRGQRDRSDLVLLSFLHALSNLSTAHSNTVEHVVKFCDGLGNMRGARWSLQIIGGIALSRLAETCACINQRAPPRR